MMPTVPSYPGQNSPIAPMAAPSPQNVLMTLADMKSSGVLVGKQTKFKQPNPSKPHPAKKALKVLR